MSRVRLYHVVAVATKSGAVTRMTGYPEPHDVACRLMKAHSAHPCRRIQLQEASPMTPDEFRAQYDSACRCLVTYRNQYGETVKGLILDDLKTSTSGEPFVYVDSFANRVPLADVLAVRATGGAW